MVSRKTDSGRLFSAIHLFGRSFEHHPDIPVARVVSFLERIDFPKEDDGCWNWLGGRGVNHYGSFSWQAKPIPSHRFAWIAFRGPIGFGNQIHHTCNNRTCVNPDHLMSLTPREHLLQYTPKNKAAQQAKATHCKRGHPLSGDNLYVYEGSFNGNQHRRCRKCMAEWSIAKWRRANPKAERIERTHCKNGHEFTPDNTYEYLGKRQCKICHNASCMVHYEKHKSARANPRPPKPPRTECKHGHPWVPENLYPTKDRKGQQIFICKTCYQISTAKAYAKLKAKHGK